MDCMLFQSMLKHRLKSSLRKSFVKSVLLLPFFLFHFERYCLCYDSLLLDVYLFIINFVSC